MIWTWLSRHGWTLVLYAALGSSLLLPSTWKHWVVLADNVAWSMIPINLVIVFSALWCYATLNRVLPNLNWSWTSLFNKKKRDKNDHRPDGSNLELAPIDHPVWGYLFGIVLLINIPQITFMEEQLFRSWAATPELIFISCILFAAVHCVMGVPLTGGMVIALVGLWFTFLFRKYGVEAAAAHHAIYDFVIVGIILVEKLIDRIKGVEQVPNATT